MIYNIQPNFLSERQVNGTSCKRATSSKSGSSALSLARDPALLHDGTDPFLVLSLIFLVQLRSLRVGRGIGIGLVEQRLNGGEDGGDVVRRTPPVLQDVQADASIGVDVGVKHF